MDDDVETVLSKEQYEELLRRLNIANVDPTIMLGILAKKEVQEKEGLGDWLKSRHVDCLNPRKLSKALPYLTSTLRYSNATVEQTALALAGSVAQLHLGEGEEAHNIEYSTECFRLLADAIVPPGYDAKEEEKRKTLREKLVLRMKLHASGLSNEERNEEAQMQQALKKAVSKLKRVIVAGCYDGDEAVFMASYQPFVSASPEEFGERVGELLEASRWGETRRDMYSLAGFLSTPLDWISKGLDVENNHCWECEKLVGDGVLESATIMICSQCKAARYCSKECQRKAWKEGHREACLYIKPAFKNYLQDMKAVESAHGGPEAHVERYGMTVGTLFCDCSLVSVLSEAPVHPCWGEPRVSHFFENMGKVKAGELWIDPELAVNELVEFEGGGRGATEKFAKGSDGDFWLVCQCLSYDYSSAKITDMSKALRMTLQRLQRRGKENSPPCVHPKEFLEWYTSKMKDHESSEPGGPACKYFMKSIGFTSLRKRHKKAMPPIKFSGEEMVAMLELVETQKMESTDTEVA